MDILLALMVYFAVDALGDNWRDRTASSTWVEDVFLKIANLLDWPAIWFWYWGTRNGREPKRFLGIAYDYFHTLKHIRNAAVAYICFQLNGWFGVLAVVILAATWFPFLYNYLLKK